MKKIEKMIKNQINSASRLDFEEVSKTCGCENNKQPLQKMALATGNVDHTTINSQKLTIAITVTILTLLVLVAGVTYKFMQRDTSYESGHFIIDINPSFEISYDTNGLVQAVSPLNEDAEVLLYNVDLIGVHYELAVSQIVESCIELGYISANRIDNAIMTTAVNELGVKDEKMTEVIKKTFTNEFSNRNILGVVIGGIHNSELAQEASKYGIDAQKLSLIKDYKAKGGEISEEKYSEISIRELYFGIYELEKQDKNNKINDAKNQAIENTNELKIQLEIFVDSIKELIQICDVYESYLSELDNISNKIQDVQNEQDASEILEELFVIIAELKEETTIGIVITSLEELLLPYIDKFNEKLNELKELEKTTEEKRNDRKEQASKKDPPELEIKPEGWQDKLEDEFSNDWYEYKDKWNDLINKPSEKQEDDKLNKQEKSKIN